MPTATDLVTDLPADFAVFGQAVDTSMAGLLGGTTGQILSKTSGTNMAFTWVTAQVGDITAVNTTAPLTGGGTSGDLTLAVSAGTTAAAGVLQITDSTSSTSTTTAASPNSVKTSYDLANAAIPKSTFTTSGDLIQATGSGTFARLGTGTSGQYLTTNGTTNSWATPSSGSLTLLSTTTLSGASTTISSISQSYKNLYVQLYGVVSSSNYELYLAPNGSSTLNYSTSNNNSGISSSSADYYRFTGGNGLTSTQQSQWVIRLENYASTTYRKIISHTGAVYMVSAADRVGSFGSGFYNATTAISSLVFSPSAGTFSAGTVLVYGEN